MWKHRAWRRWRILSSEVATGASFAMTFGYLARRLALVLPTALLASMVVFGVMRVLPGDVAATILSGGGETTHSPEVREALRQELGLDDRWPLQYGRWLLAMVDGSFGGDALVDGQPIRSQLARQVPITGLLALYALAITLVVWLPLGVVAGWKRGRWPDHVARIAMLPGVAAPSFLLALLALLGLLLLLGWSPPVVYSGPLEDPWEHALIVAVPALLLSWEYGAHVLRVTRVSVSETLSEPYVLTAVAKGLPARQVVLRHGLRNAMLPVLTALGVQFGTLLGGALILESIFGLPGVGRGLVEAALARDFPVVQSLTTLLVVAVLLLNLAIDAAYGWLDPRVSFSEHATVAT